jgi:hypothetical protein
MAKLVRSGDVAEALIKAGLIEGPLDRVRRIVIDLKAEDLPVIYVEYEVSEHILDVIPVLTGIEVKHA